MALKKCKECKQKISTKAKICPHCGAPQKRALSGCSRLFLLLIILFFVFVFIGISLDSGSQSTKVAPTPKPAKTQEQSVTFRLVDEEIHDAPIKSQIVQHLVVVGEPTESELRNELTSRFQKAQNRGGFKYHNFATNIYIYIYGSEEQAKAEQGLWIAMLEKNPIYETPHVTVDEDRLRALTAEPQILHGLTEEIRKEVFREIFTAENRATNEAKKQIPDTQIMKRLDLEEQLIQKYNEAIRQKYKLTDDQLSSIAVEGIKKGWPR